MTDYDEDELPPEGPSSSYPSTDDFERPWQYDWKRPRWNTVVPETKDNNNNNNNTFTTSSSTSSQQRPLCHSSAAVSPEEVFLDVEEDDEFSSTSQKRGKYVLTVTLMVDDKKKLKSMPAATAAAAAQKQQRKRQITYADSLLVQLIRHVSGETDLDPPQEEEVFTRLLRWPESALLEDDEEDDNQEILDKQNEDLTEEGGKDEDDEKYSTPKRRGAGANGGRARGEGGGPGLFGLGGWGKRKRNSADDGGWKPKISGLISACLCRLPPKDPNAALTNALDVVQLLSLGGIMLPALDMNNNNNNNNNAASENNNLSDQLLPKTTTTTTTAVIPPLYPPPMGGSARGNPSKPQDEDDNEYTLVLCCLHSRGKVYIYSLRQLLMRSSVSSSSIPSHKRQHSAPTEIGLDGNMASLFLGGAMLETLQNYYLPLTQPTHTIRLTVPLMRSKNPDSRHPFDTATTQQLLDASVWDTTVDGPSLRFRTKDNIPCLLVHAFDMLAVAGPGRRVRKHKNPHDNNIQTKIHQDQPTVESETILDHGSGTFLSAGAGSEFTGAASHFTAAYAALTALKLPTSGLHTGGFVTFLSLRNFATIRTVYLPFVPLRISPFAWGCINFLLVVGEGGGAERNQTVAAAAIRIDDDAHHHSNPFHRYLNSSSHPPVVQVGQAPPPTLAAAINNALEEEMLADTNNAPTTTPSPGAPGGVEKSFVSIRRFQILPIALPGIEETPSLVVGSISTCVPPSLAFLFVDNHAAQMSVIQRSLLCVNQVPIIDEETGLAPHPLFSKYRVAKRLKSATQGDGGAEPTDTFKLLTRIETHWDPRFICRIPLNDEISPSSSLWCHHGQGWSLIGGASGKASFVSWEGATSLQGAYGTDIADLEEEGGQDLTSLIEPTEDLIGPLNVGAELNIPHVEEFEDQRRVFGLYAASKLDPLEEEAVEEEEDPILMEAIESISTLSYRKASSSSLHIPGTARHANSFTHEEKSERLLKPVPSWAILEHSNLTRQQVSRQTPVISVKMGSKLFTLSLRSSVVSEQYHQRATPFQQVLSWLADKGDYFTAASLALDLLRDASTLRHLWRSFDKIDMDEEASKLQGLLDGIQPLGDSEGGDLDATLVTLADMTVACLTKGGYSMSSTLLLFLEGDKHYNATRASLMLAATAARMLSGDPDVVAAAMGQDYQPNGPSSPPSEDVLVWPVRCLLQVGTARDTLKDILVLLNATIPDELRQRCRGNVPSPPIPSMRLCKQLISLILSSSDDAATHLLSLVDEVTRAVFWDSLDHETQLALATISVDGARSLLQEEEVRGWVLNQLRNSIQGEGSAASVNVFVRMPNDWLRELVWACLESGGCDVEALRDMRPEKLDTDDAWGILEYTRSITMTRELLGSSAGTFGIDYDIVVSALLLLETRGEDWCSEMSHLSSQNLLNACCYSAGRRSNSEPLFSLDGATLMSLCYVAGNIQAGADLVGGEDGLVLECAHVLVDGARLDVDEAERFLTGNSIDEMMANDEPEESSNKFEITDWHRQLLALLEQHVVRVRKYGDFDSGLRGNIDPVFGARICLRAWLRLNRGVPKASDWIVTWLKKRLEISEESTSPHRLACAAFARALLWPAPSKLAAADDTTCLAEQLKLPDVFVIQLSHACCGLVEAYL